MPYTPGPWRWELSERGKQIRLCSRSNMTVMDFVRWGMSGAIPRFLSPEHLLRKATDHGVIVPGREHHAEWFKTLDHPDAKLIAAAPQLAEALKDVLLQLDDLGVWVRGREDAEAALKAAGVE